MVWCGSLELSQLSDEKSHHLQLRKPQPRPVRCPQPPLYKRKHAQPHLLSMHGLQDAPSKDRIGIKRQA